jgi:hypothetical protein
MKSFQVAHLNIDDVQLVVVFLPSAFDAITEQKRLEFFTTLERSAASAGLAGNVVALWQDPSHRTRFIAPPQQHPFFQIMKYEQLLAQVNQTLACAWEEVF